MRRWLLTSAEFISWKSASHVSDDQSSGESIVGVLFKVVDLPGHEAECELAMEGRAKRLGSTYPIHFALFRMYSSAL